MSNYSDYYNNLSADIADRYKKKIKEIHNVDPYTLQDADLKFDANSFPNVSSIDIVSYLVLSHSFYTKQQMKAYKSLQAYKYFEAGFVDKMGAVQISERVVVVGTVKHSQRLSMAPLKVWLICRHDGSVDTGHCTCMAGAGEVCSHVAAILYALEYITLNKSITSCTDVRASWMVPTVSKVTPLKLADLKWSEEYSTSRLPAKSVPSLSGNEIVELLQKIQDVGYSATLMRIVEPFATELKTTRTKILPSLFADLYDPKYEKVSYEELCSVSESLQFHMDEETCREIFNATKDQSKSAEWFNQRSGRITASHFKAVCRTKISTPSISLVKSVCFPVMFCFRSKATDWGITHENKALEDYFNHQNLTHANLQLERSGFVVNPSLPQFGASPDALISCDCCGEGCVEVKCPYTLRNMDIPTYAQQSSSCLQILGESVVLKRSHMYYYQMQLQLKVTGRLYCDFVLWSPNAFFTERLFFNEDLWASEYPKAAIFHQKVILPELLGRAFTRTDDKECWCICDSPDDGRPMIQCDNDDCKVQWYHLNCVSLTTIPETLWLCFSCKKI